MDAVLRNDTELECAKEVYEGNFNRPLWNIENNFDYVRINSRIRAIWPASIVIAIVYLWLIRVGQRYMSTRPPYQLRRALFFWNLALAAFSIAACYRLLPAMAHMYRRSGWTSIMCNLGTMEHRQNIAVWVGLMGFSKLVELGDTAFIVLRKQRLIFLHWYHHISVMIFLAYTTAYVAGMCFPFMTLNYVVHSVMYSYFTLKSLRIRIPRFVSMMVTAMQIFQMVLGVYVTAFVYISQVSGESCCATQEALAAAIIMYGSYLVLFVKFFVDVYWRKISIEEYSMKKND